MKKKIKQTKAEFQALMEEFFKTYKRADIWSSVSMQAHLETLEAQDLPELRDKLPHVERGIKLFEGFPEEVERWNTLREFLDIQIKFLEYKVQKESKHGK